jgi:hypothetical protein
VAQHSTAKPSKSTVTAQLPFASSSEVSAHYPFLFCGEIHDTLFLDTACDEVLLVHVPGNAGITLNEIVEKMSSKR